MIPDSLLAPLRAALLLSTLALGAVVAIAAPEGNAPAPPVLTEDLGLALIDGFPATDYADNGSLALGVPGLLRADGGTDVVNSMGTYSSAFDAGALGPRWVAWHLDSKDIGKSGRSNDFRPDEMLPVALQVTPNDYRGSGYDRGHQCPSGDRTSNSDANSSTFLMSNMLPQAPDLNRQVWRKFEEYLRSQLKDGTNEIYVVCGGTGTLGRIGEGRINIPAKCWKVALILPVGDGDLKRVSADTRVIAVEMPNVDGDATAKGGWRDFLTTTDALEAETGLDLWSRVPVEVQQVIEASVDSGRAKPTRAGEVAPLEADEK